MRLVDRNGVEVLDQEECLRLIATRAVGRIGIVDSGQPIILPMNYFLVGDSVVMRTSSGTKLQHAQGSPACFEVDEIDVTTQAGWSVLAVGRLETITEYDESKVRAARSLPLSPWAAGERPYWMRLVTQRLTGRRVPSAGVAGRD
jgi:nitroimidazol reductase NimA-like FMN-containing flavoprotein (pyridoxamine 5'-phosphate oxidase superfamily)